jgi:hypothetical protein
LGITYIDSALLWKIGIRTIDTTALPLLHYDVFSLEKRNAPTTDDEPDRMDIGIHLNPVIVHPPDKPPGDSVMGPMALYPYNDFCDHLRIWRTKMGIKQRA